MTVGDFWGIEQINLDFYSKDGVSLLAVNTEKGRVAFEHLKENADVFDSDQESAFKRQHNIRLATDRPLNTDEYWADLIVKTFLIS